MTNPPGDTARERRAEQLARDGEFAPALEAAERIQDPASRDAALVAVVEAQVLAGDFSAASVTPTRIRSPWFLAEALRLISLAAARIGERSGARAGFKLAADGTARVSPELRGPMLGRIAVAEARAATASDEYLEVARTTLQLVRSEVERVEPGKVLDAVAACVRARLARERGDGRAALDALGEANWLALTLDDREAREEALEAIVVWEARLGEFTLAAETARGIGTSWPRSRAIFVACEAGVRQGLIPPPDFVGGIENRWLLGLIQAAIATGPRSLPEAHGARSGPSVLNSVYGDMTAAMRPDAVANTGAFAAAGAPSYMESENVQLDQNVQFSVFRPNVVRPGDWTPLLAFAHLAERRPGETGPAPLERVEKEAKRILAEQAGEFPRVTQDSSQAVPREGEITFQPIVGGVEFNPAARSFRWVEDVHREEFRFRAAAPLDGRTARGHMSVFLGSILVADIPLAFRVDSAHQPSPAEPTERAAARPYRNIFASYSHKDLSIVEAVERHALSMGDRYLRDRVHLRSGEVWGRRIAEMIEEADVFQLFWSRNSMTSDFVRQEWEHALGLGRPHFVRPTYWEDPMPKMHQPPLPPPDLAKLHFERLPMQPLEDPEGVTEEAPIRAGGRLSDPEYDPSSWIRREAEVPHRHAAEAYAPTMPSMRPQLRYRLRLAWIGPGALVWGMLLAVAVVLLVVRPNQRMVRVGQVLIAVSIVGILGSFILSRWRSR